MSPEIGRAVIADPQPFVEGSQLNTAPQLTTPEGEKGGMVGPGQEGIVEEFVKGVPLHLNDGIREAEARGACTFLASVAIRVLRARFERPRNSSSVAHQSHAHCREGHREGRRKALPHAHQLLVVCVCMRVHAFMCLCFSACMCGFRVELALVLVGRHILATLALDAFPERALKHHYV